MFWGQSASKGPSISVISTRKEYFTSLLTFLPRVHLHLLLQLEEIIFYHHCSISGALDKNKTKRPRQVRELILDCDPEILYFWSFGRKKKDGEEKGGKHFVKENIWKANEMRNGEKKGKFRASETFL